MQQNFKALKIHLSSEILEDGGAVDGSGGSNTATAEAPALQMTMDPEFTINN